MLMRFHRWAMAFDPCHPVALSSQRRLQTM